MKKQSNLRKAGISALSILTGIAPTLATTPNKFKRKEKPEGCTVYTKEMIAPYKGFSVKSEVSKTRGDLFIDFEGDGINEILGSIDLSRVSGITEETPIEPNLLKYMAMIGTLPMETYRVSTVESLMKENPFLRDRINFRTISPDLTNHITKSKSEEEKAIKEGRTSAFPLNDETDYTYQVPSITLLNQPIPDFKRTLTNSQGLENTKTYFSIIRNQNQKPQYGVLEFSPDGTYESKGEIVGIVDLRTLTGAHPTKRPVSGVVAKEMASLGSMPMKVYILPKAQEKILNPAYKAEVDRTYSPLLQRINVKPNSEIEKILTEGNPGDLILKNLSNQTYIFHPPKISKKKIKKAR